MTMTSNRSIYTCANSTGTAITGEHTNHAGTKSINNSSCNAGENGSSNKSNLLFLRIFLPLQKMLVVKTPAMIPLAVTPAGRKNKRRQLCRLTGMVLLGLFASQPLWAHVIVGELEKMSKTDAAILYLVLGYQHILPLGFDHILFVLSLFLLSPKLKPVLLQATAFTIAHSVTLGLAMYNIIKIPSAVIEPLIALSIMYVALENIFSPRLKTSRIGVVFIFGLVHGLGFAGALGSLGLPQNAYLLSLIMFNVGVELGQLTIILLAYFLLAKWFGKKPYYRKFIVIPLSALIAVIAACWTVQRIFF